MAQIRVVSIEGNGPSCRHGPTILFERTVVGKLSSGDKLVRFFACSACRSRKDCDFFVLESNWLRTKSAGLHQVEERTASACATTINQKQLSKRLKQWLLLTTADRKFCLDCSLIVLKEEAALHLRHKIKGDITYEMAMQPSKLMQPLESNSKEAQYFFSEKSVKLILETLTNFGAVNVICIGCPRIHESIRTSLTNGMQSLLLDMDSRFEQFYPEANFERFNMFNFHFYNGDNGKRTYNQFVKRDGRLAIVVDPPFGGLAELLANTIRIAMKDKVDETIPVFWIFPYFLEKKVVEHMPNFKMADYKVTYGNHNDYSSDKRKKKGSPVRIFTNVDLSKFVLPADEGYRLCSDCARYVDERNVHCAVCNICPSKDGGTYKHCDQCARCVKSSYCHCSCCHHCHLPGSCVTARETARSDEVISGQGCFKCGDPGHKRAQCGKRKRKRH